MKQAVKRLSGGKVRIDVLAARDELAAGTLSDQDRATIERMLPGFIDRLAQGGRPPDAASEKQ